VSVLKKPFTKGLRFFSNDVLILPFPVTDATVVAQVKGLDSYMIKKIGKDWLEGLSVLLIREFLLVKRACIDSLTGLLSSLHLEEYLDSASGKS